MQNTKLVYGIAILVMTILLTLFVAHGTVLAATFTVTKTADTDDGTCDADCSLRETIAAASADDSIQIPAGTYTLPLGS